MKENFTQMSLMIYTHNISLRGSIIYTPQPNVLAKRKIIIIIIEMARNIFLKVKFLLVKFKIY